jgi:thiol-disulfide isomerase/thioredoxin
VTAGSRPAGWVALGLLVLAMGAALVRTALNLAAADVPAAAQLPTQTDLAMGAPAPEFRLATLAGDSLALSELRGQVVVVDFWATWCGPCRPALRRLQEMHQADTSGQLSCVAINVQSPWDAVEPFVHSEGLSLPVLRGNITVQLAYRVQALPTLFVIDQTGTIRYQHVGYAPGAETAVADIVEQLLAPRSR